MMKKLHTEYILAAVTHGICNVANSDFLQARNHASMALAFDQIYKVQIPPEELRALFEELTRLDIVSVIEDPFTSTYYLYHETNSDRYYKSRSEDAEHVIGKVELLGQSWLSEALNNIFAVASESDTTDRSDEVARVPASDRVVRLDHNEPKYLEAAKSLDDVIKEFREDHSFGNSPPPERDRVLGELEAGRDYIKKQAKQSGEVRFGTIKELLIEPLNWIMKTFGKEALAALAKEAIKLFIKLFGGP